MTSILIAGATGLVGGHALALALADPRVGHVVAPTRRALPVHAKLQNPLSELAQLSADESWWTVDGVICALGTTRAAAGSAEAFRQVDFHYALTMARFARAGGATRMALTSSMGANPNSVFLYLRVKGELEAAVERLDWDSLTIARPGLLGGERREKRPAERLSALVLGALAPALPPRLRINPATEVARILLEGAIAGPRGRHIIEAGEIASGRN
jgi:uncharacterized protein YbjT (DUF2867 family)